MKRWEDLEIYRNLPPEEIPKRFKEFAHFISEQLSPAGFRLKESKTQKRLFRFHDDLEQAIYFDNGSRWEKNQNNIRIYISIKPLFTDTPDNTYWIFEGFQIAPAFQMSYPLTQEYLLLAAHLVERIKQYILPFFDKYATVDKVVNHYQQLLAHYKIPQDGFIPPNGIAEKLIYECAFRNRNRRVFIEFHSKYLQEWQAYQAEFKNHPAYRQDTLAYIEKLNTIKQILEEEDLYKQELERQNERAITYVSSFDKKKPAH